MKLTTNKSYGNTPEYFRQRRKRLGESLRVKERERWHRRKETEYEGRHQLSRNSTAKTLGLKCKDFPQEMGELKLAQLNLTRKLKGTKMKSSKSNFSGITKLRKALVAHADGTKDINVACKVSGKILQSLTVKLAYEKALSAGKTRVIPFLEA